MEREQMLKLFLLEAMFSFTHLVENLISSHVIPIYLNHFFFLLSFSLNNSGWYLKPVDFY